ncbi:2-O-methyltransferase NoeI [Stieleria maiorica]|uniref:2-O-methyltransferase NoeI n=1 Tax=Stieleria maiorica TaxID=2795974 RepID=A0A5B9MEG2_9BACT|nr:FkbM family methyltransferase [Stieleria maiorica]QEF99488.1 2-O-methyltransferase NoeI [Stieleria maiorica]
MKRLIKKLFDSVGVEIRLKRNVTAVREKEKREEVLRQWALLHRYQPQTILDIGANEGQSAALFRQLFPGVAIYSFEPLADCHQQVAHFLESHGPGTAFHCALGESNRQTTIHRNEFTPSSSLLPMNTLHKTEFPKTTRSRPEQVDVKRLDDIAETQQWADPLVIKVDVQGFEEPVIRGGLDTFTRARAVVIELTSYPLYESQSTFERVQQQLQSIGFVFRGVIDQMRSPQDGRILQFDALFENDSPGPS